MLLREAIQGSSALSSSSPSTSWSADLLMVWTGAVCRKTKTIDEKGAGGCVSAKGGFIYKEIYNVFNKTLD